MRKAQAMQSTSLENRTLSFIIFYLLFTIFLVPGVLRAIDCSSVLIRVHLWLYIIDSFSVFSP
jgi:hypothetical protein